MTLVVGIKCTNGIVLAADGAATYGVMGQSTIRQAVKKKLKIIDGQVIIGTSGTVGLGQRFAGEIETLWRDKKFSGQSNKPVPHHQAMTMIREVLWKHINYEIEVARCSAQTIGPMAIQKCITSTVVALPVSHDLCLFQFDEQGAPEEATDDLPFIAIGSGQHIADPFLAFLRRVLWNDEPPTLSQGILSAVWTLNHAIKTNPGGISDPIQVIKLTKKGTSAKAEELSQGEIEGENIELIEKAESKLGEILEMTASGSDEQTAPPTGTEA